ncbi:DUF2510 domain-containing protein [Streptomyces goshikiensis]|uniref:DUF2510 domain-containing protein n=1 Tax=Streptomyces goshikiensis TaxID=1942 RepID=UPI0033F5E6A2
MTGWCMAASLRALRCVRGGAGPGSGPTPAESAGRPGYDATSGRNRRLAEFCRLTESHREKKCSLEGLDSPVTGPGGPRFLAMVLPCTSLKPRTELGTLTASPGDGEHAAREGYYPDPSIPGYVRYWNGLSWVPGTSRPAPPVDETGPVFLDETSATEALPEPSPARSPVPLPVPSPEPDPASEPVMWQADPAHQHGFGGPRDARVSWGSREEPPGPVRGAGVSLVRTAAASPAPGSAPAPDPAPGPRPRAGPVARGRRGARFRARARLVVRVRRGARVRSRAGSRSRSAVRGRSGARRGPGGRPRARVARRR